MNMKLKVAEYIAAAVSAKRNIFCKRILRLLPSVHDSRSP